MGDGTIRLWSVRAAVPIQQGAWLYSMATSADGRTSEFSPGLAMSRRRD